MADTTGKTKMRNCLDKENDVGQVLIALLPSK